MTSQGLHNAGQGVPLSAGTSARAVLPATGRPATTLKTMSVPKRLAFWLPSGISHTHRHQSLLSAVPVPPVSLGRRWGLDVISRSRNLDPAVALGPRSIGQAHGRCLLGLSVKLLCPAWIRTGRCSPAAGEDRRQGREPQGGSGAEESASTTFLGAGPQGTWASCLPRRAGRGAVSLIRGIRVT